MHIVNTRSELQQARAGLASVAFVPTMGSLHDGHLSLVRRGEQLCGAVVVSIFVNPTQFGPNEDFATYPRDVDRDLRMLEAAGCDVAWVPGVDDIYPSGFATSVSVGGDEPESLTRILEGARRLGHFDGVATVVSILTNAVQPDVLVLGQKDAQQAAVVRHMLSDLAMPVELFVAPIVREADGLAMSSRNTYLNPQERAEASQIYAALRDVERAWAEGERDAAVLIAIVEERLAGLTSGEVDYVSIVDANNFTVISGRVDADSVSVLTAARFGKTRLLDNVLLHAL